MKITAGLGSVDEYVRYVRAGADEFFCGYVPYEWNRKYGTILPLNRREVLGVNVQIGSESELRILAALVRKYDRPVHLTFNSLYYIPKQYPEIADIICRCRKLGFSSFIVADPALLVYMKEHGIRCELHLSGETAEVNSRMLEVFEGLDIRRLIFHRKNSFADMESVIRQERKQEGCGIREFEAFVLNELCQFSGAFCNSLHCDELGYLCRVPYRLGQEADCPGKQKRFTEEIPERLPYDEEGYLCGATGCGLCALYQLQRAGITHLKLVGRGNYTDFMERDIRNLRKALKILKQYDSEEMYQKIMKQTLFSKGCSGNCYYRESESFAERAYSHDFLCTLLAENGFELVTVYGDDSFDPAGETTQRAIYVAKKTGKEN